MGTRAKILLVILSSKDLGRLPHQSAHQVNQRFMTSSIQLHKTHKLFTLNIQNISRGDFEPLKRGGLNYHHGVATIKWRGVVDSTSPLIWGAIVSTPPLMEGVIDSTTPLIGGVIDLGYR